MNKILREIKKTYHRKSCYSTCAFIVSRTSVVKQPSQLLLKTTGIRKPCQNSLFSYYHSNSNIYPRKILKPKLFPVSDYSHWRSFSYSSFGAAVSTATPVLTFQEYLTYIHDISGMPWWSVIVLTTLGIRFCVTLPFAVHQSQVFSRLENIHHELNNLAPELKAEVLASAKANKWEYNRTKRTYKAKLYQQYSKRILRDNCHPFKSILLVIIQLPIWITFSFSLRNLVHMMPTRNIVAELTNLQLQCGGLLWFTDLTQPDLIMPVLLGAVNLSLIEMHYLRNIGAGNLLQKIVVNVMRMFSICVAVIAYFNPSCVVLYWLCSSCFGLGQALLLMHPRVRRAVNIPKTPRESATPYEDIFRNMKKYVS